MSEKKKKLIIVLCAVVLAQILLVFGIMSILGKTEQTGFTLSSNKLVLEVGSSVKILVEDETKNMTYTSSNDKVVTVDENGLVTGVSEGTAFVSVKSGESESICKVLVNKSEYAVVLGYSKLTLVEGSNMEFHAKLMAHGKEYDGEVKWSISDTDTSKCSLEVDKNKAIFTGTEVGTYTVKAASEKAESTCTIKIISANAKRADAPVLTVEHCDTLLWDKVNHLNTYELKIGTDPWISVEGTTYDISDYVTVERLKDGESLSVAIRTVTDDNYDLWDSYISKISVAHDYEKNEVEDATCTKPGVMVYTCKHCDRTYTDNNYLEPHQWKDGVCATCNTERTKGITYVIDDNYIPMVTADDAANPDSKWMKKYAPYYQGLEEKDRTTPRLLWQAVYENRDKIPAADREKCYYVVGISDEKATEVHVRAKYDDGKNGELPVLYIGAGAFGGHATLKTIVMPTSVVELRSSVFHTCLNLETVIMPGITFLPHIDYPAYMTNNFNNCYNLKTVVVGDGFRNDGRNWFSQKNAPEGYKGTADLYVSGDGSKLAKYDVNYSLSYGLEILTGNVYYQQPANSNKKVCEKWYYISDTEIGIQHHEYEGGFCKHCGAYDNKGIKYGYDPVLKCYFVDGNMDCKQKTVKIPETYNDGEHGVKKVGYLAYCAFAGNTTIEKVILPESVTDLRGSAFQSCSNLKTVVMPGVKELYLRDVPEYRMNNFNDCHKLTTLVVADGFINGGRNFFDQDNSGEKGILDVYVYGTTPPSLTIDYYKDKCQLLSGKIYYYDENGTCATWKFDKNKNVILAADHTYASGACTKCGRWDGKGIEYGYNPGDIHTPDKKPCYYVANNTKCNLEIVNIAATFNDGIHGELPVAYVSNGAFSGNTVIKKVVLPESVTTLRGYAFSNCTNLETVIMPGVRVIASNQPNFNGGDGLGYQRRNFSDCTNLKTVVVADNLYVDDEHFVHVMASNGCTKAHVNLYIKGSTINKVNKNNNPCLTGNIYYYNADGACGTWSFDKSGNVVLKASHTFVNGVCNNCGAWDSKGIVYGYNPGDAQTPNQEACYYVAKNTDCTLETVRVAATYNDGIHGELPVAYVANGAFAGNTVIKTVILPESVTTLRGYAFSGCTNLETIIMPGVSQMARVSNWIGGDGLAYDRRNFNECPNLKTVLVADNFYADDEFFVHTSAANGCTKPHVNLFVKGTRVRTVNFVNNPCLTGNVYYYDETGTCGTWKYDQDGNIKLEADHTYVNGACKQCGKWDDKGIAYGYNPGDAETNNEPCYYVANNQYYTGTTVEVLSTYNDGVHGELPVAYVAQNAFNSNKNIQTVRLPESVKVLRGYSFWGCSNLETVIMPGVVRLWRGNPVGGVRLVEYRNFALCTALKTVVVGDNFQLQDQQFTHGAGNDTPCTGAHVQLHVYGDNYNSVFQSQYSSCLKSTVYYYDENGACGSGTWQYDQDGNVTPNGLYKHEFVGGECTNCHAWDDRGITYGYNPGDAETNNEPCYYVADNTAYTGTTVEVPSEYNDGVHGTLPVAYVAQNAFANNTNIQTVRLSESVKVLRGWSFIGCTNLETVIMPGVQKLWRGTSYEGVGRLVEYRNFAFCTAIKTVVVGDNFILADEHFKYSTNYSTLCTDAHVQLYVYGDNYSRIESAANPCVKSTVYYYNENAVHGDGTWKYDQDGNVELMTHTYVDDKCSTCGAYDAKGIVYGYNPGDQETNNEPCYYVAGNAAYTGTTVEVLSTYNDGEHGELPVAYVAQFAFNGNANIKTVRLPESVKVLRGWSFAGCTNLETVIMPGVQKLWRGTSYEGVGRLVEYRNFASCTALKTVVVDEGFILSDQQFVHGADHNTVCTDPHVQLYVYGDNYSTSHFTNNKGFNPCVKSTIYFYDETGASGTWHYDAETGDVVVVQTLARTITSALRKAMSWLNID